MLTSNPLLTPGDYDVISVAGVSSPGVVEVTGAERPYKWDTKEAAGAQGATITYRGWDLAKPKLKFRFWRADQISEFYQSFVPLLQYDASKTSPKPVDCYHPALVASNIKSVVVTNLGQLTHEGAQLYSVTVDLLEYRPAPKVNATSTPKSAAPNNTNKSSGATGPQHSPAEDALDKAIADARAQAARPLPSNT